MDGALATYVFAALAADNEPLAYGAEFVLLRERDGEQRILVLGEEADHVVLSGAARVLAEAGLALSAVATANGDLTLDAAKPTAAAKAPDPAEGLLALAVYEAVAVANPPLAARPFALTLSHCRKTGYVVTAYVEDAEQLALQGAATACAQAGRELQLKVADDGMEGLELTFPAAQPAVA